MPVRYILSSVLVRLSIFSQLSVIQNMGCVFSVYPFPLWWLREYTLCLIIIIKSEVWTNPLFRVRSWNNGMRCMSFYILNVSEWRNHIKSFHTLPQLEKWKSCHYDDVIMGVIASQIISLTIVYSTVYSDAVQRKHQSSASLAFVCSAQMASNAENVSIWWRHHDTDAIPSKN